ncbi:unnamed protein product [Pleuronectes platessa]|uniref:Uncharacterized protein n=1 Tax=Pleuronectes platessa TaxID=8262 RepID=A0A9N7TG62_PLEPL|nr:unnamed protein product [Pleuronectes platessa]
MPIRLSQLVIGRVFVGSTCGSRTHQVTGSPAGSRVSHGLMEPTQEQCSGAPPANPINLLEEAQVILDVLSQSSVRPGSSASPSSTASTVITQPAPALCSIIRRQAESHRFKNKLLSLGDLCSAGVRQKQRSTTMRRPPDV